MNHLMVMVTSAVFGLRRVRRGGRLAHESASCPGLHLRQVDPSGVGGTRCCPVWCFKYQLGLMLDTLVVSELSVVEEFLRFPKVLGHE
jgi:hypothetical protein